MQKNKLRLSFQCCFGQGPFGLFAKLPPTQCPPHTDETLRQAVNTNFFVFGLVLPRIEPKFAVLILDVLFIRPLIECFIERYAFKAGKSHF